MPSKRRKTKALSQPLARGVSTPNRGPTVSAHSRGVRVTHTELITDVTVSGESTYSASLYSFPTNPGQSGTFPWLSELAKNYEKFRFVRLQLQYGARCPATTDGMVVLAQVPDPDDPGLSAATEEVRRQLISYRGSISGSIWTDHKLTAYSHTGIKESYIQHSAVQSYLDDRWSSLGTLYLFVSHNSATLSALGDVFISYEVELLDPVLDVSGSTTRNLVDRVVFSRTSEQLTTTNVAQYQGGINVGKMDNPIPYTTPSTGYTSSYSRPASASALGPKISVHNPDDVQLCSFGFCNKTRVSPPTYEDYFGTFNMCGLINSASSDDSGLYYDYFLEEKPSGSSDWVILPDSLVSAVKKHVQYLGTKVLDGLLRYAWQVTMEVTGLFVATSLYRLRQHADAGIASKVLYSADFTLGPTSHSVFPAAAVTSQVRCFGPLGRRNMSQPVSNNQKTDNKKASSPLAEPGQVIVSILPCDLIDPPAYSSLQSALKERGATAELLR